LPELDLLLNTLGNAKLAQYKCLLLFIAGINGS
jgi:hypothetical protein